MTKLRVVLAGVGLTAALAACGNGPPPDISTNASAAAGPSIGTVVPGSTAATAKVAGTDQLKFDPGVTAVKVNDVVQWSNSGTAPHTITFDAAGGTAVDDADFGPGKTYAIKFTVAGKYTYKCTIHPGMSGEIDVS